MCWYNGIKIRKLTEYCKTIKLLDFVRKIEKYEVWNMKNSKIVDIFLPNDLISTVTLLYPCVWIWLRQSITYTYVELKYVW